MDQCDTTQRESKSTRASTTSIRLRISSAAHATATCPYIQRSSHIVSPRWFRCFGSKAHTDKGPQRSSHIGKRLLKMSSIMNCYHKRKLKHNEKLLNHNRRSAKTMTKHAFKTIGIVSSIWSTQSLSLVPPGSGKTVLKQSRPPKVSTLYNGF